ncbi:MAG TPA: FAD-binding protein [Polyangiaceae bacterium]|nr:FAD-binding protein [Polyangiaceae bacterium]
MKVLIIGAGFAGVAAALAAKRAGATVTVVHSRAGASELYAGVVDGALRVVGDAQRALLPELARALGLRLEPRTIIASREGVVRGAAGSDRSLLNLAPLAGKRVGLVDPGRDDWDAPLLARALGESAWARASGTRFEVVPFDLLEKGYQRRVSPYDFASGFERAERPAWLAQLLKNKRGPDAWLFGPWLGVRLELASQLSTSVGLPVGEVTSAPGGVAGARFEMHRDSLLLALPAEVVVEPVRSVSARKAGVSIKLDDGRELLADALVLASGGFVSGAIELRGSLSGAEPAGFALAIEGLPAVEVRGELGHPVSSLFGVDLAARGRVTLERAGLPITSQGAVVGAPRVFAAGDVTAAETPSVGHALASGLAAGAAAAAAG